jgi:uncharacterized protein YbbK (DUF523 family)
MEGEVLTIEQLLGRVQPGTRVLVSACLLGQPTRYDGAHKEDAQLLDRLHELGATITPICPEMAGGLPVPRPAAEPRRGNGRDVLAGREPVFTVESGKDVTQAFVDGARAAVTTARTVQAGLAILQERSPSCGVHSTHSGGALVDGPGVAAAALLAAGISVAAVD